MTEIIEKPGHGERPWRKVAYWAIGIGALFVGMYCTVHDAVGAGPETPKSQAETFISQPLPQ